MLTTSESEEENVEVEVAKDEVSVLYYGDEDEISTCACGRNSKCQSSKHCICFKEKRPCNGCHHTKTLCINK